MTLPQLTADSVFLTDGGLETTLIFHRGLDLPHFAAFPLLDTEAGRAELRAYFAPYFALAREHGTGFVLDTPTWRASADWGPLLGYDLDDLWRVNREAVAFARELGGPAPTVVNGVVGPRGDGYAVGATMSPGEAEDYHSLQATAFATAGADMLTAVTMTYAEEAIGVARAARASGLPHVISFTVETDGRLPSGMALGEAIAVVEAATDSGPAYYMVNCAHPSHFARALDGDWTARIGGLRANASALSHAELDAAETLDEGDPAALGAQHAALSATLPNVAVLGGCCGTDARHVAAVGSAWR